MATLPATGSISLSQIYAVFDKSLGPPISLTSASTGIYGTITTSSSFKPDGVAPHAMSEFRGYNHSTKDTTPPSIPTGFDCNGGENYEPVYIYWNPSTDNVAVTGYELQRRTDFNGIWSTKYIGPDTYYYDFNNYDILYYYRVRAFDAAGNYSDYTFEISWMARNPL